MNKALDILETWMNAINSGDVKKLASLYNNKAVLIPTFSNRLLDTPEKIANYFEEMAKKKDLSISLHEKTVITQEIGNELFSLSGIYKWAFSIDEELLVFEARFSYIFDLSNPKPILHHHSSQIPRML